MAGRRYGTGKPTRTVARAQRSSVKFSGLLEFALTPEQRAAGAFDQLRSVARSHPERGRPALEDATRHMLGLVRAITEGDTRGIG